MAEETTQEFNVEQPQTETQENKHELFKVIREFVPDLLSTFPEYKENIDQGIYDVLAEDYDTQEATALFEHCKTVYPERFFDILYQNTDIFTNNEINTEFLPGIEFKDLWKQDISDKTRTIIWKYLQLVMLSIITSVNDGASFGDTAKLFEAINEDEFKSKIEETIAGMQHMFEAGENGNDGDVSNIDLGSLPNPEDVQNHINGMLGGKLGTLAREIAEETANELNIDMEDATNVNDVFKKMFKNPGKLMSMVKNIGDKLENKLKSGDINESELIKEATEMMGKMKNMPGMKNIENMLGQFGLPLGKNAKVNMGAFQSHMKQNMKMAQQRERMMKKLEQRRLEQSQQSGVDNGEGITVEEVDEMSAHQALPSTITQTSNNEFVFTSGDKPEKSSRKSKASKNKGKKKKKIKK